MKENGQFDLFNSQRLASAEDKGKVALGNFINTLRATGHVGGVAFLSKEYPNSPMTLSIEVLTKLNMGPPT